MTGTGGRGVAHGGRGARVRWVAVGDDQCAGIGGQMSESLLGGGGVVVVIGGGIGSGGGGGGAQTHAQNTIHLSAAYSCISILTFSVVRQNSLVPS